MTGRALGLVYFSAVRDQHSGADAHLVFRHGLQLTDEGGHIGNGLCIHQMVRIRKVLHPRIPSLVVSKVDDLRNDDREELAGDARGSTIRGSRPGWTVADQAGS